MGGCSGAAPAGASSRIRNTELPHPRGIPAALPPSQTQGGQLCPPPWKEVVVSVLVHHHPALQDEEAGRPDTWTGAPNWCHEAPPTLRDPFAPGSPATPQSCHLPGGAQLSSRGQSRPVGPRGDWCLLAARPPGGPPAFWRKGGPVRRWEAGCQPCTLRRISVRSAF